MRGIKSNSKSLVKSADKHKLLLFGIIAVFAIALALPATLGFANETTSDADSTTETNSYTVNGHLYDADTKNPVEGYLEIYWIYENLEGGDEEVEVESDGSYTFTMDPEDNILYGVIIALNPDPNNMYACQFKTLPTTTTENWDFYLNHGGAFWSFDKVTGLNRYGIGGGSSIVTPEGDEFAWTSIMPTILLGEIPHLIVNDGSTFTESKENKTLTYHWKSNSSYEEYTLVFVARPKIDSDPAYKFDKWQIDKKDVPAESYVVKPGTMQFRISAVFEETDTPDPGEVSAHIYKDTARPPATPIPVKDAYAYMVGFYPETGETFVSNYADYNDETGLFKIKEVPEDIMGLIVVGAPGHTNRAQFYSSAFPATDFYLSEGVQCTVDISEGVDKVLLEKGSNIKITFDGIELQELVLPEDIDFTDFVLPFGMSYNGTFDFMDNGELNFSFDRNSVDVGHLSLTFKVISKEGYVQNGWLKDGQKISGKYELKPGEKDFTIAPNYGSDDPVNPQEPSFINAQTSDPLATCVAVLAFLTIASAGAIIYNRIVRKKN